MPHIFTNKQASNDLANVLSPVEDNPFFLTKMMTVDREAV